VFVCLAAVLLALAFPVAPKAAGGEVLLPNCSNVAFGGTPAPVEWSSGCLGGSVNLDRLSWTGWGEPVATATGVVHYNDCEPSCAQGSVFDYPVEFRVDEIERCASSLGPQLYYTRSTTVVDFPPENAAGRPAGPSEPITFSAFCPTPGYLVKTWSSAATLGAFVEEGEYDGARLENYFGPPSKRKRGSYLTCVKHWSSIGLTVKLGALDPDADSCDAGRFLSAILKSRRWHTPSGVRLGEPARKAASASVGGCTIALCRTNGYILSRHRSQCALGRFPSVVADTGGGRVRRLLVFSHFCE
jgi:hypothetical protein